MYVALLLEDSEQNNSYFNKVNAEVLIVADRTHILRLSLLLNLKDKSFCAYKNICI